MPSLTDEELEERLASAGKSLAQPPAVLDELLALLDEVEQLLSKVEQSPPKTMQAILTPLTKVLVTKSLLEHPDTDVKVGVASCISEITRITAPDAPYNDEKMKDVFRLIVSSFEGLANISSRSYEKRATILETVAKVRSCVIMLDLECDQMIVDMFEHFLKAIRSYHSVSINANMATIMTLVIEESEDISTDLLAPILATLKRNNKDASSIAKNLAERVIQNSADKLRPYLQQAVKSLGTSFNEYSEVVASVCRENTDIVGHGNESVTKDQPVVEEKSTSASPAQDPGTPVAQDDREGTNYQEKDSTAIRSPKSVVSNGINETGTNKITTEENSSNKVDSEGQLDAKSTLKDEADDHDAQEPEKLEAEADVEKVQTEAENHDSPDKDVHTSPIEVGPVEAAESLDKGEDRSVEAVTEASKPVEAHSEVSKPVEAVTEASKPVEAHSEVSKPVEAVTEASPAQSGSHPDENLSETEVKETKEEKFVDEEMVSVDTAPKKASKEESNLEVKKQRRSGKKRTVDLSDKDKALTEEAASKNNDGCASDSEARTLDQAEEPKDASNKKEHGSALKKQQRSRKKRTDDLSDKDKALTEEVASKNDDGCASDSEARTLDQAEKPKGASNKKGYGSALKKQQRSGKKQTDDLSDKDKALTEEVASKNNASDSEARTLDQTEKPKDANNKKESGSALKKEDVKKSGRGKPTSEKETPKPSARKNQGKDTVTPRKSLSKPTKHEAVQEETPRTSTKRKNTPGKEKASDLEHGENLVGSKVRVFWPKDNEYYEGVIASFDSAKKKHRVLYNDGDEEILNLKKEQWDFLDDVVSNGGQDVEQSSHDTSSDVLVKRKGNMSSETTSKRQKVEGSAKSKQKDTPTKTSSVSKDDGKAESGSKGNSQKASKKTADNRSKDQSQKSGGKVQVDSAKASGKSKEDQSQKSGGKAQVDSAKASGKSKEEDVGKNSSQTKQDTPRTPKSKGKTTPGGKALVSAKSTKSSTSKVKEADQKKEKTPDTAKSTETAAKGKATDSAKSREGETKVGKKRKK
ncbi:sister chromatid cohesion protein PDS5 homolog C-like isoform X2 [Salvia hispanica]|uniref:sister chromatid cohesion protein PDS5 homolog C-like isoform X2 n=1 Tax=Salvia hispanica TaxID=49212 RepID=UPI002009347E|nr:sister chromatid cohesion protein PDS5 homolog C-like isoform X2 [Salvia hispanica]